MSFGEAIVTVFFRKYATFKSRASRSEFWWAWLLVTLVNIPLVVWGGVEALGEALGGERVGLGVMILTWAWYLYTFLPLLAVTTRRLHDTGRSCFFALAYCFTCLATSVPAAMLPDDALSDWGQIFLVTLLAVLVLSLFMLSLMCKRGDSGHNSYGPPPL